MRKKLSAQELAHKLALVGRQMENTLKYSTILAYAEARYVKGYADDELIDACKSIAPKYGVVVVDDVNPKGREFTKTDFELSKDEDDGLEDLINDYKTSHPEIVESANIPFAFREDNDTYVMGDLFIAKKMLDNAGINYDETANRLILPDYYDASEEDIDELNNMFNLTINESVVRQNRHIKESLNRERIISSNARFRKRI